MGRITPSFRQLYEETISELRTELQAALVDLSHKSAFDLLLKEAWNPEQAAMGNSTLPTVSDKLNVMASIHNRKLIAVLTKGLKEKDREIEELKQRVSSLEDKLNDSTSIRICRFLRYKPFYSTQYEYCVHFITFYEILLFSPSIYSDYKAVWRRPNMYPLLLQELFCIVFSSNH